MRFLSINTNFLNLADMGVGGLDAVLLSDLPGNLRPPPRGAVSDTVPGWAPEDGSCQRRHPVGEKRYERQSNKIDKDTQ